MDAATEDLYERLLHLGDAQLRIAPIRWDNADAKVARQVERLHRQLFPDPTKTAFTWERFYSFMRNPDVTLIGAWLGDRLVGMATLYEIRTLSRTALLFEEFVVDSEVRGKGIGQKIDAYLLDYAKEHTAATRIEGTVNVENKNTWHVHMKSGFFDRKNDTILYVIKR